MPRIRDRDEKLAEAKADPGIFEAMRKSIARRARNQKAPYHCIAAVEAACTMPFDEGVERERELFDELENSAEARALRYAFFAEREVAKLPDIPRETPLRPIKNAAIVGAGTMGGGIAMSFAEFGFPVKLLEVSQEALDRGLARIRGNYETSVKRGSLTEAEMDRRLALIEPVTSYDDIGQCDVVIEAVFERIPVKEEVFKKLDAVMKPGALLYTQHLGHRHRHHGQCDEAAAGRGRHAFLRARQRHETVRGRQRGEERPRHAWRRRWSSAARSARSVRWPAMATALSPTAAARPSAPR